MKKDKSMCTGCYNNFYNFGGATGQTKECWSFEKAEVKLRKRVHINQVPPWNQKPTQMLSCYREPQFVFVDGDQKC